MAGTQARAAGGWEDVPRNFWARGAINFVARKHPWMTDFGALHFRPDGPETRSDFAHALVLAFAPEAPPAPSVTFKDLAPSDPFYPFASVAVKRKWIPREDGNFLPNQPVTMIDVHRALVRALGLFDVAQGINAVHSANGYRYKHPNNLGALLVGMLLGLRFNHGAEGLDVRPGQALSRAEVAWSLYRAYLAKTRDSWRLSSLESSGYKNLHFGGKSPEMRKVVEFGLKYVAYPYIYAGEWYRSTPGGYCCGAQPQGGFDCSGLMWWLLKSPSSTYSNVKIRGYTGWSLPQRSSRDMATVGKLTYKQARAGDLMFYDGDDDGTVDHVDLYLGYGWALDSSSGTGGVVVVNVSDGWYRDHFVHARHIVPA